MHLRCGRKTLDLTAPRIMGVVNVTHDSFSDGGAFIEFPRALDHAEQLIAEGADVLDIGGESTRPGAVEVPEHIEMARVVPLVEALRSRDCIISVDTRKPLVMAAALRAGADILNDVTGFSHPDSLAVAAGSDCGLVLMHMQGDPKTMQNAPVYGDAPSEVAEFLVGRAQQLISAGVTKDRIVVDQGFGFGKSLQHNKDLFASIPQLCRLGFPVLVGVSRKSMIGALTGRDVSRRDVGSIVASLMAIQRGAKIVRVHDVAAMRDAISVWSQL